MGLKEVKLKSGAGREWTRKWGGLGKSGEREGKGDEAGEGVELGVEERCGAFRMLNLVPIFCQVLFNSL